MFYLGVLKSESRPSSDIGFLSDNTKPRQQLYNEILYALRAYI